MIAISLNQDINCDKVCRLIKNYIEKNIKSREQAANTILKITLVETKDYIEPELLIEDKS